MTSGLEIATWLDELDVDDVSVRREVGEYITTIDCALLTYRQDVIGMRIDEQIQQQRQSRGKGKAATDATDFVQVNRTRNRK